MGTCPGQDSRFWKPEDIFEMACARCGHAVEFFKNDGARRCAHCGERMVNPKISIGCARWCKMAKACLGYDPAQAEAGDAPALLEQLISAMQTQFGDDQRRIAHALHVLSYAEEMLRTESADPRVVCAAAILHDIGIQEAERRHGSSAGRYQELEGPPIARRIMTELAMDADTIEHVCRIVGSHHSAGDIDTPEFRIVWDADWLVNIPEDYADRDPARLRDLVARVFRTATGRQIATRVFLGTSGTDQQP
jgi:HD superfamily phosphodiesterase/DNA-directed RNA polymerase subunit RPC12/RpoP